MLQFSLYAVSITNLETEIDTNMVEVKEPASSHEEFV
jgi:hypothetical protein